MCIHLNPYELEWNRIKFSLISLQYISTHVDWDEYMRIKQGLTFFYWWHMYTWVRRPKSRYNNGLITKLVNIFADVKERGEERKESLTLMQVTSCTEP
jgi:hypothetical protein